VEGTLDGAYLVALVVALWGTGIALGTERSAAELLAPTRRAGLLGRVALVDVVIAPLVAGMACRRAAPRLAARLPRPLTLASNVGLATVVAIVLARDADAVVGSAGERVPLATALVIRRRHAPMPSTA